MKKFIFVFFILFTVLFLISCGDTFSVTTDIDTDEELLSYLAQDKDYTVYEENFGASTVNSSEEEESDKEADAVVYILNTSSKKYHLSSCSSVKTIKAENLGESSDLSYITSAGYVACKRCNP